MNNNHVSGEEIFWRFVRVDLMALPDDSRPTQGEIHEYDELARRAFGAEPEQATLIQFRKRTRDLAPSAVLQYTTPLGLIGSVYLNTPWPLAKVRKYLYFEHSGHRPIFARVKGRFHVPGAYTCDYNLGQLFAVDPYGILEVDSAHGVMVVVYQGVICDLLDPEIRPEVVPPTNQVDPSAIYVHRTSVGELLDSFRGKKPVWRDPL